MSNGIGGRGDSVFPDAEGQRSALTVTTVPLLGRDPAPRLGLCRSEACEIISLKKGLFVLSL